MDAEHLHYLSNQSGRKRVDYGGEDRISQLPNEILVAILSFLPLKRAATTTILSSRWLHLWKRIIESDRISQLPDQIISTILSFLPLKQAARTCVLSSRWSDSWKHNPYLHFGARRVPMWGPKTRYMSMVNSILHTHKALPLKRLSICLYVNKSHGLAATITKLLEYVILKKVEHLVLNFGCWEDHDKVVLGESLRRINTINENPQTLVFSKYLKSLILKFLEVSGEDMELVLRNSPLLENLKMVEVSLSSDMEVCGSLLKHLHIYECSGDKSIKVSAPNLTVINFNDLVGKLLLDNVPILENATFRIYTSEFVTHHFASFPIPQLQFLDIFLYDSTVFWSSAFPQMPNLKKLSITCQELCSHTLLPVTRLIWASPRLEKFTLKFSGFVNAPTPYMQEISNVGRSPHQHLKVFRLQLLSNVRDVSDHVVELVTCISNNCTGLCRMHINGEVKRHLLQSLVPNHVQLSFQL